jgi:hypothetical protein
VTPEPVRLPPVFTTTLVLTTYRPGRSVRLPEPDTRIEL